MEVAPEYEAGSSFLKNLSRKAKVLGRGSSPYSSFRLFILNIIRVQVKYFSEKDDTIK
ncbi:hypothetical protein [Methanosarcina sp. KYL-1]|uniref:hypothetical protein n=1 Tax=Methanosarcina sp. KYL-1 TaxID=2602068 RepID=UPI0021016BA1|nr:hypothetical protein [Methanosarcina sp. KYL-1]